MRSKAIIMLTGGLLAACCTCTDEKVKFEIPPYQYKMKDVQYAYQSGYMNGIITGIRSERNGDRDTKEMFKMLTIDSLHYFTKIYSTN